MAGYENRGRHAPPKAPGSPYGTGQTRSCNRCGQFRALLGGKARKFHPRRPIAWCCKGCCAELDAEETARTQAALQVDYSDLENRVLANASPEPCEQCDEMRAHYGKPVLCSACQKKTWRSTGYGEL